MSEPTSNRPQQAAREDEARKRSLAAALAEVKNRQASRDDVVIDLKEAERARLELLADELRPLFDDLPLDNEQFEFALTNGKPPRLWIDMTTHVRMGHDRRVYRFLKDTRAGRTVLAETHDLEKIADAVSHYVAERVLERERILEGEWSAIQLAEDSERLNAKQVRRSKWHGFLWFMVGFCLSAAGFYLWLNDGDRITGFLKQFQ